MAKNAINRLKVHERKALLAQAQAMLEQKNRKVAELQKEKEEQARKIESLVAENEKLVGGRELATEVEKLEGDEEYASVVILGGLKEMYNDIGSLDTIYFLDLKAQSWKKLSITLPKEMREFGAAVLNEEIYIFGGYANRNWQQDCYKLKNDGSWIKLASLNQQRAFISSSSLVYKGDIWVIGGFSEGYEDPLKSVEKYDISRNMWTIMPLVFLQM